MSKGAAGVNFSHEAGLGQYARSMEGRTLSSPGTQVDTSPKAGPTVEERVAAAVEKAFAQPHKSLQNHKF